jgi:hypothetical protein
MGHAFGDGPIQESRLGPCEDAGVRVEILANGHLAAAEFGQAGGEGGGRRVPEFNVEAPEFGLDEADAGPLALHDHAGGDGLDAAGGELGTDLAPQQRRDLVADQTVQQTPGLLGVHQVLVDGAGVVQGASDGGLGDLVENHPGDRHLGLEDFCEVPGDGFSLSVFVSGEVEDFHALEPILELLDLRLLGGRDDVQRPETLVDIDAHAGPRLLLVPGRDLGGVGRQVSDVPDGALHDVVRTEVTGDGAGFRRRLDDDQRFSHGA